MGSVEKKIIVKTSLEAAWDLLKDLEQIGLGFPFVASVSRIDDAKVKWNLKPPADTYLRTDFLEAKMIVKEEKYQHAWQAQGNGFSLIGVFFIEPVEQEGVELLARLVVRTEGIMSRLLGTAFSMNIDGYLDGYFQTIISKLEHSGVHESKI